MCENKCFQRGSGSVDGLLNAAEMHFFLLPDHLHALTTGFLRAGNTETTANRLSGLASPTPRLDRLTCVRGVA